jgi:hypothetical protein
VEKGNNKDVVKVEIRNGKDGVVMEIVYIYKYIYSIKPRGF